MLKNKWMAAALLLTSILVSSCGIFGKGCGCPKFGWIEVKKDVQMKS